MKNTTKLKHILQLYTVELNMDEEMNFHLTAIHKTNDSIATFIDKGYSIVLRKAYSHMLQELKKDEKLKR
jgi:hypothetical protein